MTQMATDHTAHDELGSRYQLSAADRCDSCGDQAYIRATMATGELLFCAHHGAKFKEKLQPTAIEWLDESSKLLAH